MVVGAIASAGRDQQAWTGQAGHAMKVEETELDGVLELTPQRFGDERGWFSESWNRNRFSDAGIDFDWVQDNESLSHPVGTVRGIHFQIEPRAQDKLIRVLNGRIFDVAVDLRTSSATFGSWTGRELSSDTGNQLFVPRGFGHGFVTLTPDCHIAYKVTDFYDASCDRAVAWNDPAIGIDWGIDTESVVLSDKDVAAPLLADAPDLFG